eukprot:6384195-Heterocapsa_arctica.AAC.1
MVAVMRHEHHTILQVEKARHSGVRLEQQASAANAAAKVRHAAALELQRSESFSTEIEHNWQSSSKQWQSEQAATQNQTIWDAKTNLG